MQRNRKLCVLFVVFLIVFLASLVVLVGVDISNKIKQGKYIGQDIKAKDTISVSGKGEVYAKPDLALASFSVITEKKTVAEAMAANAQKMNAVISSIKKHGVKDKDIKTTSFNIYPRYEWHKAGQPYPEGKRVLVGYQARQSLEVKIRDMQGIGAIIQAATDAGANQVGNLRFVVDKQDELKKQARQEAIKKAKAKAKELASQLGVKLVRIVSFNENSTIPRYYPLMKAASSAPGAGATPAPQIETGENKIEVNVTITYEIR